MKKTKELNNIEQYFQTEDSDYNEFAFGVYQEAIKEGTFPNPEIPLRICQEQIAQLVQNASTPIKAVEFFGKALEKEKLNEAQTLFMYEAVQYYLELNESLETEQVEILLNIHHNNLKPQPKNLTVQVLKTTDLRDKLKSLLEQEIDKLPELLEGLKDKERLEILLKMMPFIFPKVKNVHLTTGETVW